MKLKKVFEDVQIREFKTPVPLYQKDRNLPLIGDFCHWFAKNIFCTHNYEWVNIADEYDDYYCTYCEHKPQRRLFQRYF